MAVMRFNFIVAHRPHLRPFRAYNRRHEETRIHAAHDEVEAHHRHFGLTGQSMRFYFGGNDALADLRSDNYYPRGGWDDYVSSAGSFEEALDFAALLLKSWDWAQRSNGGWEERECKLTCRRRREISFAKRRMGGSDEPASGSDWG